MWNKYLEKFKLLIFIPKKVILFRLKNKLFSMLYPSNSKKMLKQIAQCKLKHDFNGFQFRIDKDKIKMIVRDMDLLSHLESRAHECFSHSFNLLGSGPVVVNYNIKVKGFEDHCYEMVLGKAEACLVKERIAQSLKNDLMKFDLQQSIKKYEPIDWHIDFKSGFRWNPRTWYEDIPIGQLPGVDVKLPWELSRFQHLTKLGLMGICDGKNATWKNEFILQVTDWIVSNPHPYGVNWRCTMDVAIRAVNWLWGFILFNDQFKASGDFKALFVKSLYLHGVHIENNLEYSFRGHNGNHYLSNLAGLIYIGLLLPCFEESDRWLAFGIQELINEMKYQVYDDGVSYEGSTSYHRLVAEIFYSCTAIIMSIDSKRREGLKQYEGSKHKVKPRLLAYTNQEYNLDDEKVFPNWYFEKLEKMADFINDVCKDNGCTPQFGDNDNGRLHIFTPSRVDSICSGRNNDHRHILSLAGKLFKRNDLINAGNNYKLDGELLLGQSRDLLIGADRSTGKALNNKKVFHGIAGTNRKIYHKFELSLDIKGDLKQCKHLSPHFYYYPNGGIAVYKNSLYYLAFAVIPSGLGGKGGHNHNDKLSFELNILGVDFIVDGGSYVYTPLPYIRNLFRSSWSHNTIAVNGKEQCMMLKDSVFSLIDRSKSHFLQVSEDMFSGKHRGFGFEHIREVHFNNSQISFIDKLERRKEAYFILNLHPSILVNYKKESGLTLSRNNVVITVNGNAISNASIEEGFYSPGYGERIANKRIIIPV